MPPSVKILENNVVSSLFIKPLPNRNTVKAKTGLGWLESRRQIDNADGLWRIHDELYDLTDFVNKHPGGSSWLSLTKGVDITEAFEIHHISETPEKILQNYHVRKASGKRNVPFTFHEDGFYRTLKREVREALKKLPKYPIKKSALITDSLLIGTFFFAIIATYYWNYLSAVISGSLLCSLTISAHNYFHQKDNFRMYYFNISFMSFKGWRVSHVLSHHLHTNTVNDMELYSVEPVFNYYPVEKKNKYFQIVLSPLWYFVTFYLSAFGHIILSLKKLDKFEIPDDLMPYTLPLIMYIFGGKSIIATFLMWNIILLVGSFQFTFVGVNGAHHHPDIFHDGDKPRATKDYDWGISQLDTAMDKIEITGSHYLVLTNFGDHALHHLFPTLDHGILGQLYPVFNKVLRDFDIDLRMNTHAGLIKGQFQQLLKTEPNRNPPDLKKKYL